MRFLATVRRHRVELRVSRDRRRKENVTAIGAPDRHRVVCAERAPLEGISVQVIGPEVGEDGRQNPRAVGREPWSEEITGLYGDALDMVAPVRPRERHRVSGPGRDVSECPVFGDIELSAPGCSIGHHAAQDRYGGAHHFSAITVEGNCQERTRPHEHQMARARDSPVASALDERAVRAGTTRQENNLRLVEAATAPNGEHDAISPPSGPSST